MRLSSILRFTIMVIGLVTGKRSRRTQVCDNQFGNPCVKICENPTKIHYDDSIYLLPNFNDGRKHIANKTKKTENTLTLSSPNNTVCPNDSQEGFPLCPHYVVINNDPNRVPAIVFEARCACRACVGSNVKRCTKVFNYRTVLYKRKGSNCYDRHLKAFAIACRCIDYQSQGITKSISPDLLND